MPSFDASRLAIDAGVCQSRHVSGHDFLAAPSPMGAFGHTYSHNYTRLPQQSCLGTLFRFLACQRPAPPFPERFCLFRSALHRRPGHPQYVCSLNRSCATGSKTVCGIDSVGTEKWCVAKPGQRGPNKSIVDDSEAERVSEGLGSDECGGRWTMLGL